MARNVNAQRFIDIIRGKRKESMLSFLCYVIYSILCPLIFPLIWFIRHKLLNSVVVIGDSHCNFFSGNEAISFAKINGIYGGINSCTDKLFNYCTLHLGGALAYNLNKYDTTVKAKEKVEYLINKNYFRKDARILCCFGEIDLRVHVIRQAEKQNVSYHQIVDNIASNYLEFLLSLSQKGYRVYCWGAIPTQKDNVYDNPEFPRYSDEITRNKATEYFNEKLKLACEQNNIGFISIFDELIDENYKTKPEFISSDTCHLSQRAMRIAKPKLKALH